jgi:hypothetical protein
LQPLQAAAGSAGITPQDLCPSQQATLPCIWDPDSLQLPSFAAVPIDLGDGVSIDIVQVSRCHAFEM